MDERTQRAIDTLQDLVDDLRDEKKSIASLVSVNPKGEEDKEVLTVVIKNTRDKYLFKSEVKAVLLGLKATGEHTESWNICLKRVSEEIDKMEGVPDGSL
jgi:hypothetical protein